MVECHVEGPCTSQNSGISSINHLTLAGTYIGKNILLQLERHPCKMPICNDTLDNKSVGNF